jgi:hypothetical protein
MATSFQVTFDAAEPAQLGTFWAGLLGYVEQPPPPGFDTWDAALAAIGFPEGQRDGAYGIIDPSGTGPRLFFQRVPEPKTAKNRVHLDVGVSGGFAEPLDQRKVTVEKAAERAVALGATRVGAHEEAGGQFHVTCLDPEGNEFCLQ